MNSMRKPRRVSNTREVGSKYEQIAEVYLKNKGYTILCMNYRCKFGEIDIIAQDHEYTVFVEVKYRSRCSYGYPREAVDYKKQKKIFTVAQHYLRHANKYNEGCRFDIIEILGESLTHIIAAF